MKSSSKLFERLALWVFFSFVLGACSFNSIGPKRPAVEAPADETAVDGTRVDGTRVDGTAGSSSLEPGETPEVSVNPYTLGRPDIPAEAQRRFSVALEHLKQNRLSPAESRFSSLTRDYPSLSGPWLNLGLVYQRKDRTALAQAQFKKAIEVNRSNLSAYNQLAISLRKEGRFAEAEQQYKAALAVWANHSESHRNLAILYDLYMGRSADALVHYERAWELAQDKSVKIWMLDLKRQIAARAVVQGDK